MRPCGHFQVAHSLLLDSAILWERVKLFSWSENKQMFTIQPTEKAFKFQWRQLRNETENVVLKPTRQRRGGHSSTSWFSSSGLSKSSVQKNFQFSFCVKMDFKMYSLME